MLPPRWEPMKKILSQNSRSFWQNDASLRLLKSAVVPLQTDFVRCGNRNRCWTTVTNGTRCNATVHAWQIWHRQINVATGSDVGGKHTRQTKAAPHFNALRSRQSSSSAARRRHCLATAAGLAARTPRSCRPLHAATSRSRAAAYLTLSRTLLLAATPCTGWMCDRTVILLLLLPATLLLCRYRAGFRALIAGQLKFSALLSRNSWSLAELTARIDSIALEWNSSGWCQPLSPEFNRRMKRPTIAPYSYDMWQ